MLQMKEVSYTYSNHKRALIDINVDLNKGKVTGLIGKNGSGKSTLFLNLVGILKPTSGQVIWENQKLVYDKRSLHELRKKVGLVLQDPDIQSFYTKVYEDMAFALRNMGLEETEVNNRIEEALEKVGALELKEENLQYLSYGQKKRIAIASVLAMKQQVVLLDEPTAGLDPEGVERIIEIIDKIKEEGIKVLVSSHDMDFIYRVCDYLYVLHQGQIVDEGDKKRVFRQESRLKEMGLAEPWLMKVHKYMRLPLFEKEEALYKYFGNK